MTGSSQLLQGNARERPHKLVSGRHVYPGGIEKMTLPLRCHGSTEGIRRTRHLSQRRQIRWPTTHDHVQHNQMPPKPPPRFQVTRVCVNASLQLTNQVWIASRGGRPPEAWPMTKRETRCPGNFWSVNTASADSSNSSEPVGIGSLSVKPEGVRLAR